MFAGLAGLFLVVFTACEQEYEILPEPVDVNPGDVTDCGFTPISTTRFSVYDCNPVFTTPDGDTSVQVDSLGFHSTEVLGHPFYQIWYSATSGSGYGLGYAVSGNGTDWDTHETNPLLSSQSGQWDQDSMDAITVVWDRAVGQYVMAYQGVTLPANALDPGRWGLGIATSPDGVTWTKHPNNPVIDFNTLLGVPGQHQPCWPLTITTGDYGFKGYIAAQPANYPPYGDPICPMFAATASDLSSWTLGAEPVLRVDQWYDAAGMTGASIVDFGGILYMFYIGFEGWDQGAGYVTSRDHHLAMATSTDGGNTWVKDPTNPLPIWVTADGLVSAVGAQRVGDRIHVWITDYYGEIDQQAVGYYLFEPDISPHP